MCCERELRFPVCVSEPVRASSLVMMQFALIFEPSIYILRFFLINFCESISRVISGCFALKSAFVDGIASKFVKCPEKRVFFHQVKNYFFDAVWLTFCSHNEKWFFVVHAKCHRSVSPSLARVKAVAYKKWEKKRMASKVWTRWILIGIKISDMKSDLSDHK